MRSSASGNPARLDEVHPILYIDAPAAADQGQRGGDHQVAYLAIGVDIDGRKHALGCWIQDTEGAKFWQKVVTDLRNRRGSRHPDRLPVTYGSDGSARRDPVGLSRDGGARRVVHAIRNAMRFVSCKGPQGGRPRRCGRSTPRPPSRGCRAGPQAIRRQFGEQYPGAIDTWQLA